MTRSFGWIFVQTLAIVIGFNGITQAGSPFDRLLPFKRIEADPSKSYELQDVHGPWLIIAATFYGDSGAKQAHRLVLELRSEYKLPAYVYKKEFDYGDTVTGKGVDRYGQPKQMKYQHPSQFEEVAVLVGDFESFDDPNAQKTVTKLRYARPETLAGTPDNPTSQRFVLWREIQKRITPDQEKKKRGPMGSAFVTRNPLLPEEYFVDRGPDKLVLEMNKNVRYSLLNCPGPYTVQVATFRGSSTWNSKTIEEGGNLQSRLAIAAEKAHKLTTALRNQNIEAYEFHDRTQSVVTVGSFDSVGSQRADGKTEINPAIHQIMQAYGAQAQNLPGPNGLKGAMLPRSLKVAGETITFDAQAIPVRIPDFGIQTAHRGDARFR